MDKINHIITDFPVTCFELVFLDLIDLHIIPKLDSNNVRVVEMYKMLN